MELKENASPAQFMDIVKGRRSVRKYKNDPISDEKLNTILEAARWAPSWANTQCWRLVLVTDQATREQLANTCHSTRPDRPNRAAQAIMTVPVCIVACAQLGRSGFKRLPDGGQAPATDKGDWYMFDLGLALENLVLTAHALGLATVHVGAFDSAKAEQIIGAPENVKVVELIPLGYPDEQPAAPIRKEYNEWVFYNRFGQGK
ncbi:MAG: nitroreductase family protein [Chloroflexi bacterium]|nr:nitroreductase family protein [Chloroflexota bacterium]